MRGAVRPVVIVVVLIVAGGVVAGVLLTGGHSGKDVNVRSPGGGRVAPSFRLPAWRGAKRPRQRQRPGEGASASEDEDERREAERQRVRKWRRCSTSATSAMGSDVVENRRAQRDRASSTGDGDEMALAMVLRWRPGRCFHAVRVAPGRRSRVPSPSGRG